MKRTIIKRLRTTTDLRTGESSVSIYDTALNSKMRSLYGVIFALAEGLKITPKKFAKWNDKIDEKKYAKEFKDELGVIIQKNNDKATEGLKLSKEYKIKE